MFVSLQNLLPNLLCIISSSVVEKGFSVLGRGFTLVRRAAPILWHISGSTHTVKAI